MHYSVFNQGRKKHDGSLLLIGVNALLSGSWAGDYGGEIATEIELIRSTEEEKSKQVANAKRYGETRNALASKPQDAAADGARSAQRVRAADRGGQVQLA